MKASDFNAERRRFTANSSIALTAGLFGGQHLLFAAESSGAAGTQARPSSDGAKYGKHIVLAQKNEPTERGIPIVATLGADIPGCSSMVLSGRMPPPGPMPGHATWERHAIPEYLIHLGTDPDDPMDLGADVEFYLGKGSLRDKYVLNKTTAVYLPAGFPRCPWQVKNIKRPMTFVNILVGGNTWGGNDQSSAVLTEAELARTNTVGGYLFDEYLLSGVDGNFKHPEGGQMLAYTDCTKIAEAPITRVIRYRPDNAPYSILETQVREFGSFLIFLGIDRDDASLLGAQVELRMGEERELHSFDKSALVFVPPGVEHELKAIAAEKPFHFLEIGLGPEFPA